MSFETTTRPYEDRPLAVAAAPSRGRSTPSQLRRRRALAALSGSAVVLLSLGIGAGSSGLVAGGVLLAALLALYVFQLVRLRIRAIEPEVLATHFGWTADDLRSWPSLAATNAAEANDAGPTPTAAAGARPRPMDRWSVTQVIWAGLFGYLYNSLSTAAERLAGGSSLPRVRACLLSIVARLLARLSRQSIRRTVALSALATASTTGLFLGGGAIAGASPVAASAPAVAGAQQAAAVTTSYTVRRGDTLWGIAQRYGTTVAAIVADNGIPDPNLIFPGQVFVIPEATTAISSPSAGTSGASSVTPTAAASTASTTSYTVQSGDSLWDIARQFGTTVAAIAAANAITDPGLIFPGQVFVIPEGPSTTASTAAATAGTSAPSGTSAVVAAPEPAATTGAGPVASSATPTTVAPSSPSAASTAAPTPTATAAPATAGPAGTTTTATTTTTAAPAATAAPVATAVPATTAAPAATTATTAPATTGAAVTTGAAGSNYTIQLGDTLASIAQRFGTTVTAIVAQNGIANADVIYAGQVIVVPGGTPSTPPVSQPATLASITTPTVTAAPSPVTTAGTTPASAGQAAALAAESQLGVPYVWGGETPGVGFDCSGLAQWAWSQAGVSIPRTSEAQWTAVPHVSLSDLQPGDLLFYYNLDGTGTVDHVAMYIGSGPYGSQTIIQAPYTGATVSFTALYTTGLIGAGAP